MGGKVNKEFSGVTDAIKKIYNRDGVTGLYKGTVVSFAGVFVYRGLYFGLYDTAKALLPKDQTNIYVKYAIANATTITAGLCSYPLQTIKVRLQMDAGRGAHNYRGAFDCAS